MRRISPIPPEEKGGYINGAFQNNKSDWPQSSEKGPPHNEPGTSNEQDIQDTHKDMVSVFMHVFQLSFKDPSLERTFKSYLYRTRHNMTTFTFILGLSLNISGLVTGALTEPSNSKYYLIVISLCTVFNLGALSMLIAAYIFFKKDISVSRIPRILFIWIVFLIQLFGINMTFGSLPVTPGSEMMWIACLCYYTFVLFPLRMRYCFILNLIMFTTHSILVATIPLARSYGNVFDYGKMVSLQSNV